LIKGWFDDTRRGPIWAVGGYIGGQHRWEYFDDYWPMALANHEVPYFHMKEMRDPDGVFGKWCPPQDYKAELDDFFGGVAKVIDQSRLVGICSVVRQDDLDRFNAEFGQSLEPYPLAAYGCMLLSARENIEGMPIELVFDRVEKVHSKLSKAREYADADKIYEPGLCDCVVMTPLAKMLTWRNVPGLQAAIFSHGNFARTTRMSANGLRWSISRTIGTFGGTISNNGHSRSTGRRFRRYAVPLKHYWRTMNSMA
jgi:hypothetical protein